MRHRIGRWTRSPVVVDLGVAMGVLVITVADAWREVDANEVRVDPGYAVALILLSVMALVVRRRWPMAVLAVCMLCQTGWYALQYHGPGMNLPTMVALYTVGQHASRRSAIVVAVSVMVWALAIVEIADETREYFITSTGWALAALLLGGVVGAQRRLANEHRELAVLAAAQRDTMAQMRLDEERRSIARELHDVVAHTVAAMNVHADVAAEAIDTRPEVARRALAQVQASGRTAIDELGATLAVLRDGGSSRAPTPDLARLDDLVAHAEAAGVAVEIDRIGSSADLPSTVQLAAYRIVQEALTNVIRHARASRAMVEVHHLDDRLVVAVTDDGVGAGPASRAAETSVDSALGSESAAGPAATSASAEPRRSGRFGLVGIAERTRSVGGEVEHGPGDRGGFRVRATIPLERRSA